MGINAGNSSVNNKNVRCREKFYVNSNRCQKYLLTYNSCFFNKFSLFQFILETFSSYLSHTDHPRKVVDAKMRMRHESL